jgi:two-component system OmpR family sensor kinase
MSLRARLLAATLVLAALGLTVAGVATYGALRSFMLDRVDVQLEAAQAPALDVLADYNGLRPRFGGRGLPRPGELPQGTVAALYDAEGLPFELAIGADPGRGRSGLGYATASLPDRGEYRFLGSPVAFEGPRLRVASEGQLRLVVGVPLDEVESTLGRLVLIEVLVGIAVLAAIGGAGWWLVRLGLRPLTDIEQTAGRIAAGDLSQRIEESPPGTEVGRLGSALNTMLGRIEESFDEQARSERRLRQFVADASHELQTPLTSVRGYAELFRRGAADRPEDLANAMRRIEDEATRMGLLVDDLLLLARLDQGRPLARERVDLTALARDLVGDARVVEPDRPIEILGDPVVVVEGDRQRLAQVIGNLVSNARAHTPAGTPVAVRVWQDGDEAHVEVADRGPGMVPEHAARVFERFFRSDASRARASGGTGLGLSIVSAIAEAHGGRVSVDTAPGDGARFRVTLPLRGPAVPGTDGHVGGP